MHGQKIHGERMAYTQSRMLRRKGTPQFAQGSRVKRGGAVWFRRCLAAAGLGLQLLAPPAVADGDAPNLDEAQKLLAAGRAAQAADLLNRDLLRFAGDAAYDRLLGEALYQAGRSDEAAFAFERVLVSEPGNVEVRLKAAEIDAAQGNAVLSRELLAPLAGQSLTPAQQQALARIEGLLGAAGTGARLALHGYVLTGIGWDSNVTGGPAETALVIPALGVAPTELGSASRAHDRVGLVEAGLTLSQPIAENAWLIGSGSLRQSFYPSHKANQEGIANVDLGVVGGTERDLFGVAALAQDYLLGDVLYRQALGGRVNWKHALDSRQQLTGYFQYVDFDYPDHAIDSSVRRVAGVSSDYQPAEQPWALQYGAYGGVDYAKDPDKPHFSYRIWGLHAGGSLPLGERLSLTVGALYEAHEYMAEDALYLAWRQDRLRSVGISLDYRMGDNWHLVPQYTYTRNGSTLDLYDYSRSTFMLLAKWEFSK